MIVVFILMFLASSATGATAGLYTLGIWWRFALSLALTLALWGAVIAILLWN